MSLGCECVNLSARHWSQVRNGHLGLWCQLWKWVQGSQHQSLVGPVCVHGSTTSYCCEPRKCSVCAFTNELLSLPGRKEEGLSAVYVSCEFYV